ncbi:unnamed protein product [marine sediment metagenome]|uniref:Uncharacterized protein n=1 Tax=marine sediment metagenome TaxID=412755 RepID=X0SXR4_9ZZZZ
MPHTPEGLARNMSGAEVGSYQELAFDPVYWQNDFEEVYVECLTCGLEADDNTVTEDGDVRAGTFEANQCPNCGGTNLFMGET